MALDDRDWYNERHIKREQKNNKQKGIDQKQLIHSLILSFAIYGFVSMVVDLSKYIKGKQKTQQNQQTVIKK